MSVSDESQLPSSDDIRNPAFLRALDSVPTSLVLVDPSGKISFVTSAAAAMLQCERKHLLGQAIEVLVPPAHRAEYAKRVAALQSSPGSKPMGVGDELTVLRMDASEFSAELVLNPLLTAEGTWVIACIFDLTERKQFAADARERNARLEAYLEAASEGLITVDASGNIEMVNKATERIFGYDRSELLGQRLEVLIPETRRRGHAEVRQRYFSAPKLRPMGEGLELFGRRKDGTQFPVDVGLNIVRIGNRTVAIAFVSDVSEKRRLQEQSQVLGTLLDLQQQLSISQRGDTPSADPVTSLDTRAAFAEAFEKARTDRQGLHAVVYSVERLEQITARLGGRTADRIVIFVSQYIANTLQNEGDELFRWDGSTFVALVRRDSAALHREVTEACGKRLEYFVEHSGAKSLLIIALRFEILPLDSSQLSDVTSEIERFTLSVGSV